MDLTRVVLDGPFDLKIERVPVPERRESDILVEAIYTGISSGTERMWFEGTNPALKSGRRGYPYYPGYEFVGRVIEAGSTPARAKVGDTVVAMVPHASHAVLDGRRPFAVVGAAFPARRGVLAALTSTALHSCRRGGVEIGSAVAVVGLGVLGALVVQVARAAGASPIIVVNRSPDKLDLARSIGADLALSLNEASWIRQVADLTEGHGADVAIECTGVQIGMTAAVEAVRKRGRVVVAGFHTSPFEISGEALFAKELDIVGVRSTGGPSLSYEYTRWNSESNFASAVVLLERGTVGHDGLFSDLLPATSIDKAYSRLSQVPGPMQIVLEW